MKNVFNSVARVEQLAVSHNMSVSRLAMTAGSTHPPLLRPNPADAS